MNDLGSPFTAPDHDRLAQLEDDLLDRANLVLKQGWEEFRHVWSNGEVLGTALVLRDETQLWRFGETTESALQRWAFDLWGLIDGQTDAEAGSPRTRAWFDAVSAAVEPAYRPGR